jgi:hypothetical protein
LLLPDVVLSPHADDIVQALRVVPGTVFPKSHAFCVVKHEDVDAERNQREQAGVQLCQGERQKGERQT